METMLIPAQFKNISQKKMPVFKNLMDRTQNNIALNNKQKITI